MLPTELAGKYEERGALGAGAMGTVIEAFDRMIERRVAVKVIRLPSGGDAESVEAHARFRREAQAAGRLSHPNIVGVYDYGENADTAWIVMEMVEGGTLKGIIDRGERMPVAEIIRVMDQVLAALAYSHGRGVVHRDIKPANLMLAGDRTVKIADFGIARIENSSMTQVGTVMGTPSYMAPEQLRGEPVDARADIWAAGVVLYQLLTGEKPFEGNYTALMHRILHTEPPAPSQLSGNAPRLLDAVVARALAKRPDDRFPSAAAFAEALRGAIGGGAAMEATGGFGFAGAGPLPGLDDATIIGGRAAPPPAPKPAPAPVPAPPARGSGGAMPLIIGGGAAALVAAGVAAFFLMGQDSSPGTPPVTGQAPAPPPISQPVAPPTPAPPGPVTVAGGTPPVPTPPVTAPPIATPSPVPTPPVTATPVQPAPVQPAPVEAATPRPNPDASPPAAQGPVIAALPTPPVIAPPPVTLPPVTQPPVTQPVVTPVPPRIDFRAAAAAAANAAPCSLITGTAGDQSLALSGVVRRGGEAEIRRVLAARNIPPQAVTLNLESFDGPYCGVLDAIREVAAAPGEAPLVDIVGRRPLQDGELLRLDVQVPGRVSYVHAGYFMPSATMVHLVPGQPNLAPNQPQPAGARIRLGDASPTWPGWQVGPPYGTDLVVVVASDRPLFTSSRQGEETVDAYLGVLASALREARQQGSRVAVRAVVVETLERR